MLLIDDMVDSRWTLTVSAWLLRKNGSGEVWSMALLPTGQITAFKESFNGSVVAE